MNVEAGEPLEVPLDAAVGATLRLEGGVPLPLPLGNAEGATLKPGGGVSLVVMLGVVVAAMLGVAAGEPLAAPLAVTAGEPLAVPLAVAAAEPLPLAVVAGDLLAVAVAAGEPLAVAAGVPLAVAVVVGEPLAVPLAVAAGVPLGSGASGLLLGVALGVTAADVDGEIEREGVAVIVAVSVVVALAVALDAGVPLSEDEPVGALLIDGVGVPVAVNVVAAEDDAAALTDDTADTDVVPERELEDDMVGIALDEAVAVDVHEGDEVPGALGESVDAGVGEVDIVADAEGAGSEADALGLLAAVTVGLVLLVAGGEGEAGTAPTRRTRSLYRSAMNIVPFASMATPVGEFRKPRVAAPPSPPKPGSPEPATVKMRPSGVMRRMRLLPVSANTTPPIGSNAMPDGWERKALAASPPSPAKPLSPTPASVVMMPPTTRRIRWPPLSAMTTTPPAPTATPEGMSSDAAVAGPPSPLLPRETPLPAKVEMKRVLLTRRTRQFI